MKRFLSALLLLSALPVSVSATKPTDRADRTQIVFGYMQSDGGDAISRNYRWNVFTHIAPAPVPFTATADIVVPSSWTDRSTDLKPISVSNPEGGAAVNHGVKVICDIVNSGFQESIVNTVMADATLRTKLVGQIVSLVSDPVTGCDGVAMDIEWTSTAWNATARAGINSFMAELYPALKALDPPREVFFYVYPSYSSTLYNIPGLEPYIDYLLYSAYEDATGTFMSAVARYGSSITRADQYMAQGIPMSKMVMTLPLYGRKWNTNFPIYNSTNGSTRVSMAYSDAMYETIWQNPPYTKTYVGGTEQVNHYTIPTGGSPAYQFVTFDDNVTAEIKMRLAKNWKGTQSGGQQMPGVGFWSLIRPSQSLSPSSIDPNTGLSGGRRTDASVYTVMEEVFAPAGMREYRAETFESLNMNPSWVAPTDGPDDFGLSSAALSSVAVASGAPSGSNRAARVTYTFTDPSSRLFFKYRLLAAATPPPYTIDYQTVLVQVDHTTRFIADIYVPSGILGGGIRMVAKDGLHELEKGPVTSLATPGWHRLEWNLADSSPGNVTAYTTSEAAYFSGNGIINTAGNGARDCAFAGFEITGPAASGNVVEVDQILYTPSYADGKQYLINEVRYADLSNQFVEIYGPAGPFPTNMELRIVSGATYNTVSLSAQSITDTGNGYGYFVTGSSGVPNSALTLPYTLPINAANAPGALQLFDTATATIHDAMVYGAFGGLGSLDSPGQPIVCDTGPSWFGEVAPGKNSAGVAHTMGRYPDGSNTYAEAVDFSLMPGTPGGPNGNSIATGITTFDFSAVPTAPYITYNSGSSNSFSVQSPDPLIGNSPSGGQVHRCVDTSGGGSMSLFGDSALGNDRWMEVSGEVYVPSALQPAQAIALGVCGRSGSTFFSSSASTSGYDSGYWLIYENQSGVGLADGQADHPGEWQLVYATNDSYQAAITTVLATATDAALGLTPGSWTTFSFKVDADTPANALQASINGVEIYNGAFPEGGPQSGAFQVGFRENHGGAPASYEGTWIDNLVFTIPQTMSKATNPSPAHQAANVASPVTLSWDAVDGAISYDVYFGSTPAVAFAGNTAATSMGTFNLSSAVATYYWRVDARNGSEVVVGDVWEFSPVPPTEAPPKATDPSPINGAVNISSPVTLGWTGSDEATSYDLYYGTTNPPPFLGNYANSGVVASFDPGTEQLYWRVDPKNAAGTTTGDVWQFTPVQLPLELVYATVQTNSGGTATGANAQCLDPITDQIVSFAYGPTPTMYFYKTADGLPATPAYQNFTHDPDVTDEGSLAGFSGTAVGGKIFYAGNEATGTSARIHRLDSVSDTQGVAVSTAPPGLLLARNMDSAGTGADTWIAAVGDGAPHITVLFKATDATLTQFTQIGQVSASSLFPTGAGRAGVALSEPETGEAPRWLATADGVGSTLRLRLFEHTGAVSDPDAGYVLRSEINERCIDVKIDLGDPNSGDRPIVIGLMRTSNATDSAQVAMFQIETSGNMTEIDRVAIPRSIVVDVINARGSLLMDRTNKYVYATYRAPDASSANLIIAKIKYNLPQDPMTVTNPALSLSGPAGGPFVPATLTTDVNNSDVSTLNWSTQCDVPWLTVTPSSGSLGAESTEPVEIAANAAADSLAVGEYSGTVTYTNTDTGTEFTRTVTLSVLPSVVVDLSLLDPETVAVGQPFTIRASVSGTPSVSGYSFRIGYDGTRYSLNSATKLYPNSGDFQLGPEVPVSLGTSPNRSIPTDRYKVVSDTLSTSYDDATALFDLNFTLLQSSLIDVVIQGEGPTPLLNGATQPQPHTFTQSLPVKVTEFLVE